MAHITESKCELQQSFNWVANQYTE